MRHADTRGDGVRNPGAPTLRPQPVRSQHQASESRAGTLGKPAGWQWPPLPGRQSSHRSLRTLSAQSLNPVFSNAHISADAW